MGYTHLDKVSGVNGLAVGAKNAEVVVANSTGELYIQGVKITATAAELNAAAGTGVSSTELDFLDGALAGTQVASKAVIADANINTGVSKVTQLHIGASGSETQVTATAAELNSLDASANVESLAAPAAVSITVANTKLDLAGVGAVTLAAPGAAMLGHVKTIEMTTDNGDVTLSLTNVLGGSAATTCTWSAVGQMLVLVGGATAWHVIAESGVALT